MTSEHTLSGYEIRDLGVWVRDPADAWPFTNTQTARDVSVEHLCNVVVVKWSDEASDGDLRAA